MKYQLIKPDVNLVTVKDGRGGIFTYIPVDHKIAEFNLIKTNPGKERGYHYHKEFDEYILVVSGHGLYVVADMTGKVIDKISVSEGSCLYFERFTPHVLYAVSAMQMIALITKRWDECEEPITRIDVHEQHT